MNAHSSTAPTSTEAALDTLLRPAPDPLAEEAAGLLHGALADAWGRGEAPAAGSLRQRLARRAEQSAQKIASMVNVRRHERALIEQGPGFSVQRVYQCEPGAALRPGEPARLCIVELAPGASWMVGSVEGAAANAVARDWLLVRGSAAVAVKGASELDSPVTLHLLDHLAQGVDASAEAAQVTAGAEGAVLLLRERAASAASAGAEAAVLTSRDAPEAWQDFAPLVKRRVLWQEGPMAAILWLAEPGAVVPQHRHGHDEECLMLRGELFQDDYLLREGDYQLAPSGTGHDTVNTDTGALIYAHGDLDMQVTGGG